MSRNVTSFPKATAHAMSATLLVLAGSCSTMPAAGPSTRAVIQADNETVNGSAIRIVDLDDVVARRQVAGARTTYFAETLGDGVPAGAILGKGDVLDIAIWEAPPAALFGSVGGDSRLANSGAMARGTTLPEQMIDTDGKVTVPFVGEVSAAGRSPQQVAREIDRRLAGKAHDPQTVVRLVRNANSNVTVVGDVASSSRVPLTAKGERLLDVLAAAGGVRQPVGKMTIQITRGDRIAAMPLETVIKDPRENVRVQSGDVVTALYQPYSFTALGATGRNDELPFEGTGITLAQALGRVAGLQDSRAAVKGVFVFRWEDPALLDIPEGARLRTSPDGKVPVIYRADMKNPATFFAAQGFPIRNHDILYVSNAPLADIQKFVNVISSTILPLATAATIVP